MNFFLFIALFGTLAQAWRWPWERPDSPEWKQLSVTWSEFNKLPMDVNSSKAEGWTLNKTCDASNYFAGNRYVLEGDTAVMLLFDSNGKIAGIQNGLPKSAPGVGTLRAPWVSEGDMYVITAYFTDPQNICGGSRPSSDYIGDQLLMQTGTQYTSTVSIPFKQEDLAGTKWVRGGCFPSMGRHYWYNISPDMNCDDYFPMFLLYNRDRLTGFGWVAQGYANSTRYEHPDAKYLGLGFFLEGTKPKCLPDIPSLTTQHIYLDKRPYLNFCVI
ncbi:uncharacterized protein LOC144633648 isoform X2 [Oculina patagonica]